MPILEEIRAAGIDTGDRPAVINYIAALPIPRDRREGYLRLFAAATSTPPTLLEIEAVRSRPSP